MSKSYLFKLGAPILALSLVAACGNDEEPDPIEDDAPVEEEAPMEENDDNGGTEEAPLTGEDEAPLNQEDDNGEGNMMEEDGAGTNGGEDGAGNMDENGADGNGAEDDVLEEPTDAGQDEE